MDKLERKLMYSCKKHMVTVPAKFLKELGWKRGEMLELELVGNTIIVRNPKEREQKKGCD